MGAAGSGKSLVGRALAAELGWRFEDGDDYHSPASIEAMRRGVALTDADRAPWLAALHGVIERAIERREAVVVACSALKERYRVALRGGLRGVRFVYLRADGATLRRRLEARQGHFVGARILPSQLAALEEPTDAVTVDATRSPEEIVAIIRRELGV